MNLGGKINSQMGNHHFSSEGQKAALISKIYNIDLGGVVQSKDPPTSASVIRRPECYDINYISQSDNGGHSIYGGSGSQNPSFN